MAWIDDGSNATEANGPTISCKVTAQYDTHYNALWVEGEGVTSGEHYWTIKFDELKDTSWVGVSNLENLKQCYKFRGLMFSHNLSEGLTCLSMSFYENGIQSGDKVGLLVSIDETKLKIYFYVNDVPLGIAFDVPKETLSPLFPAIKFTGAGKATIQKETVVPANRERFIPVHEGLDGHWKLDWEQSVLGKKPPRRGITLRLKKTGETEYSFHLHVINFISGSIRNDNGKWKSAKVIITLMAGDVDRMMAESLCDVFKNIEVMEEADTSFFHDFRNSHTKPHGKLYILSGNNHLRWSRYNPGVKVVTENPFY